VFLWIFPCRGEVGGSINDNARLLLLLRPWFWFFGFFSLVNQPGFLFITFWLCLLLLYLNVLEVGKGLEEPDRK
jgi:hypothetical protein